MCKITNQWGRESFGAAMGHFGWTTIAAAGLWTASAAIAEEPSRAAESEGSVLIATREAEPGQVTPFVRSDVESNALEPISQFSEHTPELAEVDTTSEPANVPSNEPRQFTESTDLGVAYRQGVEAESAQFNGIQPGTSTRDDVLAAWEDPTRNKATNDGSVLTYEIDPFKQVDVLINDDTVSAIKIELDGCLPPKRLAKQLSLDTIDAVVVRDELGVALGQAYPERGVLFLFGPPANVLPATTGTAQSSVTHVVIQPLDANAFALRAESHLHGPYEQNIRDLETALSLAPQMAHAHWLLADIYLATGQIDLALEAATDATGLEPENAAFQLRRAQALRAICRYDEATYAVREILDRDDAPPIVKAQALHEMAQLAALGEATIAAKAIGFDTKAIELADSLATSNKIEERRAAKEVLIEAHLSIARQIAGHSFNNKLESVSQWIGRASGLAEGLIDKDGGSVELRLMVAKEALAALASFKPTKDPAPFIAEARQAAEALEQESNDDLWRRRIKWDLGQAYYHAVRIEHMRQQSASALRFGQLAIENLADGASTRQAVYDSEQLVGELYFQIGAVHAIHKQDHKSAAQWYDKALPLLTAPRPASDLLAPQRDGEELVSMGVTYWEIGEKDHALDLTLEGAELVQRAVDEGILAKSSLAVPYGNLATMYEQMGNKEDAAKYAELAKNSGPPKPAATAATNRPHTASNNQPRATQQQVKRSFSNQAAIQQQRRAQQQQMQQQRQSSAQARQPQNGPRRVY
jgi:hypothetical protein